MRFPIRVVGGSVRDAHNEGGKKGETEQSRVGTECDVFGVFAFIFIFRAHTPAGISHEKKGGKVESDEWMNGMEGQWSRWQLYMSRNWGPHSISP